MAATAATSLPGAAVTEPVSAAAAASLDTTGAQRPSPQPVQQASPLPLPLQLQPPAQGAAPPPQAATQRLAPAAAPQPTQQRAASARQAAMPQTRPAEPAQALAQPQGLVRSPLQQYPSPTATHEQVVADSELFHSALVHLRAALNITEKVPKVGGRQLDLHVLYCSVTALGGCEEVIARKQWRDAAKPFGFPDTLTAASYVLRRAYAQLLWDFEQVYFFRRTGLRLEPPLEATRGSPLSATNGASPKPEPASKRPRTQPPAAAAAAGHPAAAGAATLTPAAAATPAAASPLPPAAMPPLVALATGPAPAVRPALGAQGTVRIDSKLDAGFFCTVSVGGQEFRGLLYYQPDAHQQALSQQLPLPLPLPQLQPRPAAPVLVPSAAQPAAASPGTALAPAPVAATVTPATPGELPKRGPGRPKRSRDPEEPKPNKLPFNYFSIDARPRAREAHPDMGHIDITKKVGEMWQQASEAEKAPYIALSNADKERYHAELAAYKQRVAVAKHAQQQAEAAGLGAPAAELADGPVPNPPPDPAVGAEAFVQPPAPPQEAQEALGDTSMYAQLTM